MRLLLVSFASLCPLVCSAGPLVTITCDPPKGVSQRYGVTDEDRKKAAGGVLAPHLIAPEPNGYTGRPGAREQWCSGARGLPGRVARRCD